MLLVSDKTDEANLQLSTIQITFEGRYMDLDESVFVDVHERRCVIAHRGRDGCHINTCLGDDFLRCKGTDIRRRETDSMPYSLTVNDFA